MRQAAQPSADRPHEAQQVHADHAPRARGRGLPRLLVARQSAEDAPTRLRRAFEERWFGGKSEERIRGILPYFAARFDAFPPVLPVLGRSRSTEPETRRLVCHWHLQLADPLYRNFTGAYLVERRAGHRDPPTGSRHEALKLSASEHGGRAAYPPTPDPE